MCVTPNIKVLLTALVMRTFENDISQIAVEQHMRAFGIQRRIMPRKTLYSEPGMLHWQESIEDNTPWGFIPNATLQ